MMQFFYENVDVLQEGTKLNACVMHDRAGGEADGLTAVFADPTGKWATWNPQRGDRVRLVDTTAAPCKRRIRCGPYRPLSRL